MPLPLNLFPIKPQKILNDQKLINDDRRQNSILQIGDALLPHLNNNQGLSIPKIKINLQPYNHLGKCEINKVFTKINEFIYGIVKQKIKMSDKELMNLMKYFGIPIPKVNGALDHHQLKQKEFHVSSNFKLVQKLYKIINKENNDCQPLIGKNSYKYYIGRGNNHYLIRQVIKRRQWWSKSQKESFIPYFWEEDNCFQPGCNFVWTQWKKPKHIEFLNKNKEEEHKLYNKLDNNFHLSNKKALFMNVRNYYKKQGLNPFEIAIPLTFHIKKANKSDKEYCRFLVEYERLSNENCQNVWIIKPGENTNRGTGISVSNSLAEIQSLLNENKSGRTYIVQKYIENPLLINGRKFDIRSFATMTSMNGCLKGYFYKECYFRTSCKEFSIQNLGNKYIHLTNDAIQQHSEDYGKYESGNKLSINDFQRFLDSQHPNLQVNFVRDIFPQIERLVADSFRAVIDHIDKKRLKNQFELFGFDFMIDENFRVYLIEANTNPCLEVCCPLLSRIIPEVIDNTFRIGLDPIFQPSICIPEEKPIGGAEKGERGEKIQKNEIIGQNISPKKNRMNRRIEIIQQIKYTMIFDEKVDRELIEKEKVNEIEEEEDGGDMLEEIQEEENYLNNNDEEGGGQSDDEDEKN